jgi:5-methylcytosine-specific restriction protein A
MFYDSPAWRQVRLVVLERDQYVCQIRGPTCAIAANQVDHIIRPADGGSWYNPDNLRGACAPCNGGRGGKVGAARTNARRWKPSREW